MKSEGIDQDIGALDIQQAWQDHCLTSVRKFIKSAVVIDNEPFIVDKIKSGLLPFTLESPNDGMTEVVELDSTSAGDYAVGSVELDISNRLDVRKVSDAFAEIGIACAFVLPEDEGIDEEAVVRRVLNSAIISDIIVIDWFLYDSSSALTRRIIEEIAKSDVDENGRLRFICVYTGEPQVDSVGVDVCEALRRGGVYATEVSGGIYHAQSQNCLAVVLNKQIVSPSDLPEVLLGYFGKFADGLLPSFALAAVGAIRKNIHHMVTRFGSDLDIAYVANRLITNPPEDVSEMMRELLVSECDNALGLESVADIYLDKDAVEKWLDLRRDRISPQDYSSGKKKVDDVLIYHLLRNGIDDKGTTDDKGSPLSFPLESRNRVSIALAGGVEHSLKAEKDFSRLVVFKREAFGESKLFSSENWLPSLTTGTLLLHQEGEVRRYFVCLTPACDTLRLDKQTPFVFLEATIDDSRYSLVFMDENGDYKGLYFREKHPTLVTYCFTPDSGTERVKGSAHHLDGTKPYFTFEDVGASHRFIWLGEIRYTRAASEMAKLAGNWMRIGVNDSEHLRLTEANKFK